MASYRTTPRFDDKLAAIGLVDPRLAEAIRQECEHFATNTKPRPGHDGPGQADIWTTRVCGLYGDVIATMFALLKDESVTFFDIPFTQMPEDDPYSP